MPHPTGNAEVKTARSLNRDRATQKKIDRFLLCFCTKIYEQSTGCHVVDLCTCPPSPVNNRGRASERTTSSDSVKQTITARLTETIPPHCWLLIKFSRDPSENQYLFKAEAEAFHFRLALQLLLL